MDTEAGDRAPSRDVALVDELAHTNVPGVRRAKRWEDVLDIVAEGIEVITTVNIQHVESLNDVVAKMTGIRQRETVPDWIIELADAGRARRHVSARAPATDGARERVPGPAQGGARAASLLHEENLTALRELALMRVANQVDDELL